MKRINKLSLGTAQFGMKYGIANKLGQISFAEAKKIFLKIKSEGIYSIDTASSYEKSEEILGKIDLSGLEITSKIYLPPEKLLDVNDFINNKINFSLNLLGQKKIYGLLIHNPDVLLGKSGNEIYDQLMILKKQGKISKIGISIYSPNILEELLNKFNLDIVQSPLNIFDQRLITSGWTKILSQMKIEIQVRSIFLQGLLLNQDDVLINKFKEFKSNFDQIKNFVNNKNISVMELCLSYIFMHKEIDKVIVGIDSLLQLNQILNSLSANLDDEINFLSSNDENLIDPRNW